jgi:alkanesulfonate monooxygenase SsuD/methylene tetrahydromethanopterin reductase-like flavin-dependent oxidoreductase (luciferase family)
MRIGLFQTAQWPEGTDQSQRYRDLFEQCVLADRLGYDSVWLTEHHFSRHGITSDSLMLLSHLAARTETIRLGTAVAVLPFHDPVRLAESTAILDHLSNGRLDVGIGRGYQWTEYNGFALSFDEGAARFEEALEVLLRSWTASEPFDFDGKFHTYRGATPQPRPLQQPHPPLWHATGSDDGLRRCAERDWGVMLPQATSVDATAELVGRFRDHVDRVGTAYDPQRVVLARGMYCHADQDAAEGEFLDAYSEFLQLAARVSRPPGQPAPEAPHSPFELADGTHLLDTTLCGTPQRIIEGLHKLQHVGVEHVMLFVNLGGLSHDKVMASLELFAAEVLTQVR